MANEILSHAVRLCALVLLGFLGWFALEATRQVQVTRRLASQDRVEEARLTVRAESLAIERAKLPPRLRYRFHPDTK